jgi:phosphate-selective porin
MQGSRRLARVPVLETGGTVKAASAWVSVFLTGEQKTIDNFGWRQPNPKKPVFGGEHTGPGAIELLARASVIQTDASLFTKRRVRGFSAGDLASTAPGQPTQALQGDAPGEGAQATVSVLEGAEQMNEVTLGVSWALAYAAKLQLNFVHTWVPNFRAGENGIVSGAGSELADPTRRNTLVPSESLLALRFIFRI